MQFVKDTAVAPQARRQQARGPSVRPKSPLLCGLVGASVAALACSVALAQAPVAAPSTAQIAPLPGGLRAPTAAPSLREGVAAVVNNGIISTYDLRQRVLLLIVSSGVQPTPESLPSLEAEALRDLIDEQLQMQEIQRIETSRKVTIQPTDQEIDEDITALARQNNITGQQLLQSLATAGVEAQTLRQQIRAEASWRRYVGGAFASSIAVGEDQINSAIQRVAAASTKPQYLIGEILLDSQRAGGPEAAIAGAQQLISQIQGGAPFTGVARQFSSAPTGVSGGDAGWVMAGDLPQAVEQALEQMRPGQISQPIPVSGGVYIVILRDKRNGSDATLVDLKQAALRLPADASAADVAAAQAKLETLRGQIKGCDTLEARANAVDGVVAGDLGETDLKELSPSFRDAIAPLQPGQVSAPVRTAAGLHLVALCGRRAAGAETPSREAVRERLVEQELAMISRRQLRDLRNSASIENR
jgi:peptidyl-prolyl cis-trans isomerase SurA